MNDNKNTNVVGETETVTPKAKNKGTGYLRTHSPKAKKVQSLCLAPEDSSKTQEYPNNTEEIMTNQSNEPSVKNQAITRTILNTLEKTSSVAELKQIPASENKQETPQKVYEKPNPLKRNFKQKQDNNFNKYHNKPRSYQNNPQGKELDDKNDISLEIIREHTSVERILSIIRQRTGFMSNTFWAEIDLVQNSELPIDFSKESAKILIYSVLFNKEDIYSDLLERYGQYLKPEDFEGNLITYCANKSSYFLDKTIAWHDKLFNKKEILGDLLIKKLSYCSFRQDNNFIWLSWLERNASVEQLDMFWKSAFKYNNVVLIIEALHFKNLSNYLRNNLEEFNQLIEMCPKTHQIQELLRVPDYYIDRANKHLEQDFEHINKQFEVGLNEHLKEKKESRDEKKNDNSTEVIIKKKKNLDNPTI